MTNIEKLATMYTDPVRMANQCLEGSRMALQDAGMSEEEFMSKFKDDFSLVDVTHTFFEDKHLEMRQAFIENASKVYSEEDAALLLEVAEKIPYYLDKTEALLRNSTEMMMGYSAQLAERYAEYELK